MRNAIDLFDYDGGSEHGDTAGRLRVSAVGEVVVFDAESGIEGGSCDLPRDQVVRLCDALCAYLGSTEEPTPPWFRRLAIAGITVLVSGCIFIVAHALTWDHLHTAEAEAESLRTVPFPGTSPEVWAKWWNASRVATSIIAKADDPQGHYRKGDRIAVDHEQPSWVPPGYRLVFYTSGCPTCPVGWVLKKGADCLPEDLNCTS